MSIVEHVLAREPPVTDTAVPGLWNGSFVKKWMTPLSTPGPYRAEPGPRTTSTRLRSIGNTEEIVNALGEF